MPLQQNSSCILIHIMYLVIFLQVKVDSLTSSNNFVLLLLFITICVCSFCAHTITSVLILLIANYSKTCFDVFHIVSKLFCFLTTGISSAYLSMLTFLFNFSSQRLIFSFFGYKEIFWIYFFAI